MADDHNGSGNGSGNQMRVDSALVRELAELLSANDLSEIEVEDGDRKIRVRRELTAPAVVAAPAMSAPVIAAAATSAAVSAAVDAALPDEPALPAGEVVRSPMVGTAYLSAEPGARPFVAPGEAVGEGDTLLIVEAMKVMNPIAAPRSGILRQVMVSNAQPVEFDQPLVIIE